MMSFITTKKLSIDSYIPFLLFIVTFFIYLHNLSQSVYGGDVGDLVTAAAVTGVPHPSGYPLFTLLGILFIHILPFGTIAWRVGFITVVTSSVSVVLFYFFIKALTSDREIALLASLTLAFSYTFWLYAEVADVFGLLYLFTISLTYVAFMYYKKQKYIYLYVLSFLVGLSLTNNEVILLIFPCLAYVVFITNWRLIKNIRLLLKCIGLFILGLLPYIYIPLAALHNPPVNWDNASTLPHFLDLVLRRDYGWGTSQIIGHPALQQRFLSLIGYVWYIYIVLTPLLIFFIAIGILFIMRSKQRAVSIYLLGLLFLTGPFYTYYSNAQLMNVFVLGVNERFYGYSIIFLIIFFALGIQYVCYFFSKFLQSFAKNSNLPFYKTLFLLILLLIPVLFFIKNSQLTDFHSIWLGDILGIDFISSVPKGAYVFLLADTSQFNIEYVQYVRGFGKEVKAGVNKYPSLISNSTAIKHNSIFMDQERNFTFLKNIQYFWEPYGLLYELKIGKTALSSKKEFLAKEATIWNSFHITEIKREVNTEQVSNSLTLSQIANIYGTAAMGTGIYLIYQYHDIPDSKKYFDLAADLDPNNYQVYDALGNYYFLRKDCANAEQTYRKSMDMNPKSYNSYRGLYITYKDCFKNIQKANEINDFSLKMTGKKVK